jgi:hypothetical protein
MSSRVLLALAVVVGVLGVGAAAMLVLTGAEDEAPPPVLRAANLERCDGFATSEVRACFTREFRGMIDGREDPRPAVEAITEAARRQGGFLLANCHVVMHTVGRTYARDAGVTLASLMDYLPQDNDPGCSAGFAHGLVTGVAPDIDPSAPREAAAACADAGTRYQRYSCVHGFGHAFMRLYDDQLEPALELCTALGPDTAPDCAQGAYHDYWFAVVGADDARLARGGEKDPWRLCASQPEEYVRPCWYRALLENRTEGFTVETAADLEGLCDGLEGLQREGCITAASVIGPPDPAEQLQLCATLADPVDAANCVRGTKAQNMLDAPAAEHVRLIDGCERFGQRARAACYRWLGKILAVLTDGSFLRAGCPKVATPEGRRQCEEGARTIEDALVTFS